MSDNRTPRTSSYDARIAELEARKAELNRELELVRVELRLKKEAAVYEMLGVAEGDEVNIQFGKTNHKWRIAKSDSDGVQVYLVGKPADFQLGERTLFYSEARDGKYPINTGSPENITTK